MTRERVIVVGGGIAGVSLGSEPALDHDVVLLEAEPSLGLHSTGRWAALFTTGYGPPPVRELTRRSEAEYTRLSALPGMPALLTPRSGLFTAWDESGAAALTSLTASQPTMTAMTSGRALVARPSGMLAASLGTDRIETELVPFAPDAYLLRIPGRTEWLPVVFYALDDGTRYLHLLGQAARYSDGPTA